MRLWEKHRPRTLAGISGQPGTAYLKAVAADPGPQCVLIEGSPGVGKTTACLALAREIGCVDEWSGLHIIPATELTIDVARDLFQRSLRTMPMEGSGWHVLLIEELECCTSPAVGRFLKVALDTGMPRKTIVLATSNDTSAIDAALQQRFTVLRFGNGAAFHSACQDRLRAIWHEESGSTVIPAALATWGKSADGFSFRSALNDLELFMSLSGAKS